MNKAKTEFAMSRCIEIIEEDEENNLVSGEIIEIEKQISTIISGEAVKLLNKLDELKERQFSNCMSKTYLAGFNDRITLF